MSQTRYCLRHPKTETNLACGKCGDPICPQCLVHTPVGARCRECAQVRRLPTFDVTPAIFARSIAAGLVLAVVGVVAFSFLSPLVNRLTFGFGNFILALALGYLVGEGISVSVNRKRGRALKWVAGGSVGLVFAAMIGVNLFAFGSFNVFLLIPAAIAVYIAVNRF